MENTIAFALVGNNFHVRWRRNSDFDLFPISFLRTLFRLVLLGLSFCPIHSFILVFTILGFIQLSGKNTLWRTVFTCRRAHRCIHPGLSVSETCPACKNWRKNSCVSAFHSEFHVASVTSATSRTWRWTCWKDLRECFALPVAAPCEEKRVLLWFGAFVLFWFSFHIGILGVL